MAVAATVASDASGRDPAMARSEWCAAEVSAGWRCRVARRGSKTSSRPTRDALAQAHWLCPQPGATDRRLTCCILAALVWWLESSAVLASRCVQRFSCRGFRVAHLRQRLEAQDTVRMVAYGRVAAQGGERRAEVSGVQASAAAVEAESGGGQLVTLVVTMGHRSEGGGDRTAHCAE